jgi:hypothetical protein
VELHTPETYPSIRERPVERPGGHFRPGAPEPQSTDVCPNPRAPRSAAMGYSGQEMTWHGFRTIASTCLNELGRRPDLNELQLAYT